eukprot:Skav231866  [mRNA]  locus=scaffold2307:248072:253277:+ [translate_table: standard]
MGRSSTVNSAEKCKRCDGRFGVDPDPLSKDRKALLQKRSPGAVVCKPCYSFVHYDPVYSELKDGKVQEMLNDPAKKASFLEGRAAYCALRISGKRPGKRGAAKTKFMVGHVQSLMDFIEKFQNSKIYDTACDAKSPLREDLYRILTIADPVAKQVRLSVSDLEKFEHAKTALLKHKQGGFYSAFTIFPVGVFIMESLQQAISQSRQDQLVNSELTSAAEHAQSLGEIKKEALIKEKDGDFDISVPGISKFADMVAKLHLFQESASPELKNMPSCEASVWHITKRIDEVKTIVFEAIVTKYALKFKPLNDILEQCKNGLSSEKTLLCSEGISKLQAFQPFAKIPYCKLFGKEIAAYIDDRLGSISNLSKLMGASLATIGKMPKDDEVNETVFMNNKIKELYVMLNDKEVCAKIFDFAAVLKTGLESVKETIKVAISSWVCRTASTFPSFLGSLMETEIAVDSILKPEIVGDVCDTDEGLVDWSGIYAAYVSLDQSARTKVQVKMQGEVKTIDVHVAFLCLAGALQQVSAYSYFLVRTSKEAKDTDLFKSLYEKEYQSKKAGADAKHALSKSRLDILKNFVPHLSRMSKAIGAYDSIISKTGDGIGFMDQIQDFQAKLKAVIQTELQQCVQVMYDELDSMKLGFNQLFENVKAKFALLEMFQDKDKDKLSETSVSALVSNPEAALLLFLGGKAGSVCEGITSSVSLMVSLPKDVLISSSLSNMLAHLQKSLSEFASDQNPKSFPNGSEANLSNVSWFQGSLTLAQVMTRKLAPGETRLGLVGRCLTLLDTKKMGVEPSLKQRASAFSAGKAGCI